MNKKYFSDKYIKNSFVDLKVKNIKIIKIRTN